MIGLSDGCAMRFLFRAAGDDVAKDGFYSTAAANRGVGTPSSYATLRPAQIRFRACASVVTTGNLKPGDVVARPVEAV